ncbi:MAG: fibrobacter succinogenes major paralogous domain-containing protein, partial [Mediterranea sp.]|nr:fibrobacter succinogenes major paralogous domain-containing protein [Mediterranea sp.]
DAANGGTLGDVPSVTTANSPYYQGVFFKCGSLVGISPVPMNVAFGISTVVYSPTTNPTTGYNSGYEAGTVASGLWSDIPAIPDHLEGDFLPRKAVRDGETGPWYGDICAYLTNGVWRMPTRKEMEYGRQEFTGEEPDVEGWWRPNVTSEWLPGSPANDATGQAGKFLLSAYPDNVARLKTKWGQVISLPPSGDRMAAHAGFAAIPGTRAYYWSGSRYSGGDSANEVCLAFTRDSGTVGAHDRTMGASVRCVK